MNVLLASAAGLSAITCALHVFMGRKEAVLPLLASTDINQLAKFTNYYCWHLVTIAIGAMAVAFGYSSQGAASADLAIMAACLAMAFAVWSIVMIATFRLPPMKFAQWMLFFPIAFLGLAGCLV